MPMYDRRCDRCGELTLDCYEPVIPLADMFCHCGGTEVRVLLPGKANAVIGDEIDVTITNGLCNPDSSPRRFRSREELKRAADRAGLSNVVEHKDGKSGDRSKHTSRWV